MQQTVKRSNVSPINLNNSDASAERQFKLRVKRVHRRRILMILTAFTVVVVFFGVQMKQATQQKASAQSTLVKDKNRLRRERLKNSDLKNEISNLHDQNYLDNLIRYRFNYSKNGETIYNIPDDSNKNLKF